MIQFSSSSFRNKFCSDKQSFDEFRNRKKQFLSGFHLYNSLENGLDLIIFLIFSELHDSMHCSLPFLHVKSFLNSLNGFQKNDFDSTSQVLT